MIEGAVEALSGVPLVFPKSVLGDTDKYQEQANPVKLFVDECCDIGTGYFVHKQRLFAAYTQWAQDNGYPAFSGAKFYRRVLELNYEEVRRDNIRHFSGLRIATEVPFGWQTAGDMLVKTEENEERDQYPDIPDLKI